MAEDLQLALSVKQGNQQSLGLLYDKYASSLLGIIYRIAGNEQQAEEILQVCFVKVWNQISSFDPSGSSLLSWLMKLVRQEALVLTKSARLSNPRFNDSVYEESGRKSGGDNSFNGSIEEAAFDLTYYKGLSLPEAAAALNLTIDNLKKNISFALKRKKAIKAV